MILLVKPKGTKEELEELLEAIRNGKDVVIEAKVIREYLTNTDTVTIEQKVIESLFSEVDYLEEELNEQDEIIINLNERLTKTNAVIANLFKERKKLMQKDKCTFKRLFFKFLDFTKKVRS